MRAIEYTHFRHIPSMGEDLLKAHYTELREIEAAITDELSNYGNFDGVRFCDVSAGGIQMQGIHKEVKGYVYGEQPTIKYDFSNAKEATDMFCKLWRECDNPQFLKNFQRFLSDGQKYGWE